jgi:hypothetical protein
MKFYFTLTPLTLHMFRLFIWTNVLVSRTGRLVYEFKTVTFLLLAGMVVGHLTQPKA